jgi:hypothetical protein
MSVMAYKKLSEGAGDTAESTPMSPLAANLVLNEATASADIIQSGASSIQGVRKAARRVASQLR